MKETVTACIKCGLDHINMPCPTTILEEASQIVDGPRQDNYGHPKVNFQRIADLWEPILGANVTPHQVCLCLIQLKVARYIHAPSRDNLVDIAGYARCMEMLGE